jgi:hypothetical protein
MRVPARLVAPLFLYLPVSFARYPQMRPSQGGSRICRRPSLLVQYAMAQRPANAELFKQWIEGGGFWPIGEWKGWSSCSDKRRVQWNQKLFRQKCGPRTTPSWLGVGLMQFKREQTAPKVSEVAPPWRVEICRKLLN